MSKILVLAESGFGKSLSACGCQEPHLGIDIKGLNPKDSYFISATSKPLPRRGSEKMFPTVIPTADFKNLNLGRRVITNDGYMVANLIIALAQTPIKNIIWDDSQYVMMDYMMEKSLSTGWDAPKKVGHFMSKIFAAMEYAEQMGKNTFVLSHFDSKKKNNKGEIAFKMKTTGQTTDDGISPEGKFDITLYGLTEYNDAQKRMIRYFLTNNDGTYNAKSAPGMFPPAIPNDLGYVLDCMKAYYAGDEIPGTGKPLIDLGRPVEYVADVEATPVKTPEAAEVAPI